MLSSAQQAHIERLNGLPQTAAKRFAKGVRPKTYCRQEVACYTCKKTIVLPKCRIERAKRVFCSKACHYEGYASPLRDEVLKLYADGLKYREIAERLGKRVGTISGILHKWKTKRRWGTGDKNSRYNVRKLRDAISKCCELCGFARAVELAHITPASKGGQVEPKNVFVLCPNCHYLFDNSKLTEVELAKLEEIRVARNQ